MKLTTIKSLVAAALCAVGLSSFAAEPEAVQLWEGGPYFATCNIGADTPEDYGILTNYNDAAQVVTDALGEGWRLPSDAELKILAGTNDGDTVCSNVWTTCNGVAGRRFFGMTSGYEDKSIFLPAAGFGRLYAGVEGNYWSSEESGVYNARLLHFDEGCARADIYSRSHGLSVRAVRDTPLVTGPTVKVASVETGDPWSTITVNYTLGGVDAATDYKVAFDVTAGGQTASVTNAAAKVENKGYSQEIDTAALFGAATPDTKAKVKVSLIAINPKAAGVQLWAGGPYWAESNLGTSEVQGHSEYGALYKFANAATEVAKLDGDWRLPTKRELEKLYDDSYCTMEWDSVNEGYTFTGANVGYKDKSIFLPAAGLNDGDGRKWTYAGYYWSSEGYDGYNAWVLCFSEGSAFVDSFSRSNRFSVRAVRDPSAKPEPVATAEAEVATAEAEFWLGPTEIKVSLTTGTGYGYAVSNLTLMAEIAPSSAGGTTYLLPIGAKVGIYCVAEADYDVVGTNPYVIEEVKFDTTIDAGELPTAVVRPGTEANPWMVGDGVTAYVKGATLIINGTGAVASTPWTDKADSVVELVKTKGVTGLEGIVATLPALTAVNGLTLAELNGLAAGAVKASGFNAIAIDPATQKATLTVVVKTAASVDAKEEDWTEAATKDVEVEATSPTGFFIVAPPK